MRRRNFLKTSIGAAGAAFGLGQAPSEMLLAGIPASPPAAAGAGYDSLRTAFANPPIQNQNWTRWWWFGPQATEEGITYELGQMKKQGLAGVEIIRMCPLEPVGQFCISFRPMGGNDQCSPCRRPRIWAFASTSCWGPDGPMGAHGLRPELASTCIVRSVDDSVTGDLTATA